MCSAIEMNWPIHGIDYRTFDRLQLSHTQWYRASTNHRQSQQPPPVVKERPSKKNPAAQRRSKKQKRVSLGSCLPRQDNTQHTGHNTHPVREVLLHCGCCMQTGEAKKNRLRPRFFILFLECVLFFAQLFFFSFYFCFFFVLCQLCNQVDDALSEKKRSRLLLPLRLLLVCKSRLEECNAPGRQADRGTDRRADRLAVWSMTGLA